MNTTSASFQTRIAIRSILLICGCVRLALPASCLAERLPLQYFSTVDGLAHNSVHHIVRDSRGFVWFCTSEGLSRYDGYKFVNYDTDQGLPHRDVHDLIETRRGDYWVATADGLCQLIISSSQQRAHVSAQSKFVVFRPGQDQKSCWVNTLLEEPAGSILCGTDAGLYRFEPPTVFPLKVAGAVAKVGGGDLTLLKVGGGVPAGDLLTPVGRLPEAASHILASHLGNYSRLERLSQCTRRCPQRRLQMKGRPVAENASHIFTQMSGLPYF